MLKSLQEDMVFMYPFKRKLGRPRTSYITYIQRVLGYHEVDISADEIATLAEDRCAWGNLVIACSAAER